MAFCLSFYKGENKDNGCSPELSASLSLLMRLSLLEKEIPTSFYVFLLPQFKNSLLPFGNFMVYLFWNSWMNLGYMALLKMQNSDLGAMQYVSKK